ncbi:universal stress protein [Aurantibacter sp.]|uniref:universal stress protein n=1 Tax=Aurantibacter sp. TaxID=2807103 RepID=UPI0035C7F038
MSLNLFNTIGIGVAFSPNLEANINEASRLSLYLNSKLILIHVGEFSEEKSNKFKSLLKPYKEQGLQFEIVFKPGKPVDVILQTIEDSRIDLLLLGALKREKLVNFYLGSIARKITRKAKCSILLLTHPSVNREICEHIVVNGLDEKQTEQTVTSAIYMAHKFGSKSVTIVEEISKQKLSITVEDDTSLRKSNIEKVKLKRLEEERVDAILKNIPEDYKANLKIKSQPIFGTSGYSIGHYTEVVRADLLVMNAPKKLTFWDRIFPHDIEYILTELPSDVLIVR